MKSLRHNTSIRLFLRLSVPVNRENLEIYEELHKLRRRRLMTRSKTKYKIYDIKFMSSISTKDENVIVEEFSSMKSLHSSRYNLL